MEKDIKFSKRAESETQKIISYISAEWSESTADKFILNLEQKLSLIKRFPKLFPGYDKYKNIRKCVLTEQISLFYKIKNTEIEILTLFDTRQDPNKLKI